MSSSIGRDDSILYNVKLEGKGILGKLHPKMDAVALAPSAM